MIRHASSYILLIAALLYISLKGGSYVHDLHLGLSGTHKGLMELVYLLLMLAAVVIAVRGLLGGGRSDLGAGSVREKVEALPVSVRTAFARRPLVAGLLTLLVVAIPIGIVAMSAGGLETLGAREWILVAVMELPVAFIVLVGFRSRRTPTH